MSRPSFISFLIWLLAPFSRLINRINWRFGRPFRCTWHKARPVRKHLLPGMVVLTHKNYEFTTLFIPGYWTHSAMVASTGHIIEATAKGVCISTPEAFFSRVDDFIILKPRFCCQDSMKKAGEHAIGLVGRPYSFEFLNSGEVFYCTGLICWVYAKTLSESGQHQHFPGILREFGQGNIIRPSDLCTHREAWQEIGNFKALTANDLLTSTSN